MLACRFCDACIITLRDLVWHTNAWVATISVEHASAPSLAAVQQLTARGPGVRTTAG